MTDPPSAAKPMPRPVAPWVMGTWLGVLIALPFCLGLLSGSLALADAAFAGIGALGPLAVTAIAVGGAALGRPGWGPAPQLSGDGATRRMFLSVAPRTERVILALSVLGSCAMTALGVVAATLAGLAGLVLVAAGLAMSIAIVALALTSARHDADRVLHLDPQARTLRLGRDRRTVSIPDITDVRAAPDGVVFETLDGPRRWRLDGAPIPLVDATVERIRTEITPLGGLEPGAADARLRAEHALDPMRAALRQREPT